MNMIVEKIEFGSLPEFNTFERISLLNEMLMSNLCKINFTKVDGTIREMVCTLNPDLIPQDYKPKGDKTAAEAVFHAYVQSAAERIGTTHQADAPRDNVVLSVYSPKDGWRSFRVNNVNSIEVCDEA